MSERNTKPSWSWYALAAALCLAGAGVTAWPLMAVVDLVSGGGKQRVVVPGKGRGELPEAGTYCISYEYASVVDGRRFTTPHALRGLSCKMVQVQTGREVSIGNLRGSYTYDFPAASGYGVWQFDVDRPGAYELSAWYPEGQTGPKEVVLAVGEGFPWRMLISVFVAVPITMVCFGASLVVFLVTLVRRRARQGPGRTAGAQGQGA